MYWFFNLFGKLISSWSKRAIYSPDAIFKPLFNVCTNPKFFSFIITLIRLSSYESIQFCEESVLASLIINSSKFWNVWQRILSIASLIYFSPLYTGRRTVIKVWGELIVLFNVEIIISNNQNNNH